MKRLMTIVFSGVLIISGLTYINIKVLESSMDDILTSVGAGDFVEKVNEFTTMDPIIEYVPVEYQRKAEQVVNKTIKNKKVDKFITKQSGLILDDVLNDTNSFNPNELTNEFFDVIDDVAEEIEEVTDQAVPKEALKNKLEQQIVGYDLSTHYNSVINKAHNNLSTKQKNVLEIAKFFADNQTLIKTISLFGLAISTLLLIILNTKSLVTISLISFVLVLLNKILLPWLISILTQSGFNQTINIVLDEKIFNIAWSYIGGLFVLGIMGKLFGESYKK